MTASARQVTVSGGNFGCQTLVADTLPGRDVNGAPGIDSEVTIYASTTGGVPRNKELCSGTISGNIISGEYQRRPRDVRR